MENRKKAIFKSPIHWKQTIRNLYFSFVHPKNLALLDPTVGEKKMFSFLIMMKGEKVQKKNNISNKDIKSNTALMSKPPFPEPHWFLLSLIWSHHQTLL